MRNIITTTYSVLSILNHNMSLKNDKLSFLIPCQVMEKGGVK